MNISFSSEQLQAVNTSMHIMDSGILRVNKNGTDIPDTNSYVSLTNCSFHNGIIEIDVCGKLLPDAPNYARGFIGIVFRADSDTFESFYIRPTNGKHCEDPIRKMHGCQYFSYPEYTFSYFRERCISDYENSVNTIALNEWSHIKADIKNEDATFYVNDEMVLSVKGLKCGGDKRGTVGMYVDNGTDGLFQNLSVIYND